MSMITGVCASWLAVPLPPPLRRVSIFWLSDMTWAARLASCICEVTRRVGEVREGRWSRQRRQTSQMGQTCTTYAHSLPSPLTSNVAFAITRVGMVIRISCTFFDWLSPVVS